MVRVARDGYAPAGLTLEVRNGEPLLPLRFVMEPLNAKLRVRSEPADALVHVDGKAVGTTPVESLDLAPGHHEIRLERRGYRPPASRWKDGAGRRSRCRCAWSGTAPPSASPPPPLIPLPVREGDLVVMDATVTPPQRIKGEAAAYPEDGGEVPLPRHGEGRIHVDEKGRPQDLRVVESAGDDPQRGRGRRHRAGSSRPPARTACP